VSALPAIDPEAFAALARRVTGGTVADIAPPTVAPVKYAATNPVSQGIYFVSSAATVDGSPRTIDLVLKICRPVPESAQMPVPADVRARLLDAFRWDREADAYDSGFFETLPAGLAAPRCFGVERHADAAWIWLERVREPVREWSMADYALAARHLGRFKGEYLGGRALPAYGWLSRGVIRTWSDNLNRRVERLFDDDRLWMHPTIEAAFPAGARDRLRELFVARDRWWDEVDSLPLTLSHLDAFRSNLLARERLGATETVAIDWSFMGTAPFGAELAQLVIATLFYEGEPHRPTDLAGAAMAGYAEGLRDVGYPVDEAALARAYRLNAVARWALVLHPLSAVGKPEEEARRAASQGKSIEEIIGLIGARTRYLLALAAEGDG